MNMAEFRHDLDDRDDAEVRGLFEQHYTPITPSPDLVERLNQLVLREVQSVYHAEAVVAPAPAPRPSLLERMRRWLDGLRVVLGEGARPRVEFAWFVEPERFQSLTATLN